MRERKERENISTTIINSTTKNNGTENNNNTNNDKNNNNATKTTPTMAQQEQQKTGGRYGEKNMLAKENKKHQPFAAQGQVPGTRYQVLCVQWRQGSNSSSTWTVDLGPYLDPMITKVGPYVPNPLRA